MVNFIIFYENKRNLIMLAAAGHETRRLQALRGKLTDI